MDLNSTGKFIAERRKDLNLTQSKLAEKLNISEKTVSKWECGKGFPDTSLILPLCNELKITSNELLSARVLADDEYKGKAEENLVELKSTIEKQNKLFIRIDIIFIFFAVSLLLISALAFEYFNIPIGYKIGLFCFSIVFLIVAIIVCVIIECKTGFYQCKHCNHKFIPSYNNFIWAAHMGFTRKLKCPNCGKKDWCKKVQ